MTLTSLNRYQAFASHLLISLIIFAVILVCITQYWYPGILFDTANGWKAIGLIIGIDLILGPLLTLIVFNPRKSSLKFDLSIIAAIQLLALSYGCWTIHTSRPIALAFINNSFHTLYANANNAQEIQSRINELGSDQLFYVFNDSIQSNQLTPTNFQPYKVYSKEVILLDSPYFLKNNDGSNFLIQLDPTLSSNRYVRVDSSTGSILSFSASLLD